MNIQFNKIILDGFMSFDHEEIDLLDLGLVQLSGKNKFENLASSNGSGKSAIFEGILWSLTGSTSRGATDVANNILNKGVYASIDITLDDTNYVITRSKNHCDIGTSLSILRNGEDVSGNTLTKSKEILATELGASLDYDTLTSIIVLSQGLPGRLSTLKPSSRKSRLEELSKTDHYLEELQSKINSAITTISSRINALNSKVLECNTKINSSRFTINTSQNKIMEIQNKSDSLIDEATANSYESKLIPELQAEISESNTKIYQMNSTLGSITSEINSLEREFEQRRRASETYWDQYNSIQNSVCPTCGQNLKDQSVLDKTKSELEMKIADNKKFLIDINSRLKELREQLATIRSELALENEELQNKSAELQMYSSQLSDYKSYSNSTSLLQESISTNEELIREQEAQVKELQDQIARENEQLAIANYYKNQLSRKFRSFLLEGVVNYMNTKSIEYSPYLFENQGAVSLEIDGNNIDIYLGNRRFENLSGGEGRRVDIILQLIQRDLARNESGFSSSLLVLDEILDNLDSVGADSVIRLLEYKSPDINTLVIVSHKQDITIPSDKRISVVKGADQISHIYKGE